MKKTIALLLALVLALGVLTACGETKPTETTEQTETTETTEQTEQTETTEPVEVEDPNGLRAGESVTVYTPEDFIAAYNDLYKEDGKYNEIKLGENMNLTGKDMIPDDAEFPVWDLVSYLVVRMPEHTQLDLNGYTLTCRAIQGLDASKILSLGQIVDTYQGGKIVLWAWSSHNILNRAVRLAGEYPEFVRQINVTNEIKDAADHEYIIPENVKLYMANSSVKFAPASITMKSGATIGFNKDAGSAMAGAKEIIFECKNAADHEREGINLATQVIDVE